MGEAFISLIAGVMALFYTKIAEYLLYNSRLFLYGEVVRFNTQIFWFALEYVPHFPIKKDLLSAVIHCASHLGYVGRVDLLKHHAIHNPLISIYERGHLYKSNITLFK